MQLRFHSLKALSFTPKRYLNFRTVSHNTAKAVEIEINLLLCRVEVTRLNSILASDLSGLKHSSTINMCKLTPFTNAHQIIVQRNLSTIVQSKNRPMEMTD